jgi:hypothetical protein
MTGRMIPSWVAFLAALDTIIAGFIWTTFFPAAPYAVMVGGITALSGAYFGKRVLDKKYLNSDGKNKESGEQHEP